MFVLVCYIVIILLILLKLFTVFTTFECTDNKCLVGKVALITGGNEGLGLEAALILASRGCKVILADINNSEESVARVKEETENPNISWVHVDLASLASVRKCAREILETETKLDILINNAGVAVKNGFTKDGLHENMQINYFGHFLLTHLLIDLLKNSKDARIVGANSILAYTHTLTSPENLNLAPHSKINLVKELLPYGNSKIGILIWMRLMAQKMKPFGIKCYTVHTGAAHTGIFLSSIKRLKISNFRVMAYHTIVRVLIFFLGKSVRRAADTLVECAISKRCAGLSGKYFWNGKVFPDPPIVHNKELCLGIWKETERLVQLKDDEKLGIDE